MVSISICSCYDIYYVEEMADDNELEYYDENATLSSSKEKSRRNVWTEKKNAALVEIVKVESIFT